VGRKQGVSGIGKPNSGMDISSAPSIGPEPAGSPPTFDELKPLLDEMSRDPLFRKCHRAGRFLERIVAAQLKERFPRFPKNRIKQCYLEAAKNEEVSEADDPASWEAGLKSGRSGKRSEPQPDMNLLVYRAAEDLGLLEYRGLGKWYDHPARNLWRTLRERLVKFFDAKHIEAQPLKKYPKFIISIHEYELRIERTPLPVVSAEPRQKVNIAQPVITPASGLDGAMRPVRGVKPRLKETSNTSTSRKYGKYDLKNAEWIRGKSCFKDFGALLHYLEDVRIADKFDIYDDVEFFIKNIEATPVTFNFGPFHHYYCTPHLEPPRWLYSTLTFEHCPANNIAAQTLRPFIDGSGLNDYLRAVRVGDCLILIRGGVVYSVPTILTKDEPLTKHLITNVAHYAWFPVIGATDDTSIAHGIVFSNRDRTLHPDGGYAFTPCLISCAPLIPNVKQEGALCKEDGAQLHSIWIEMMSHTPLFFEAEKVSAIGMMR
jgi:hypothetical protein